MNAIAKAPTIAGAGQSLSMYGISWTSYVTISDALPDKHGVRLIYCDGRLTFVTTSRRHEWFAECFNHLVVAVADGCEIPWESSGSATYRREAKNSGAEGDKTFYFGPNAELMLGPVNIDLETQPPPDLAIEVEVSHPADEAMLVWGRLGVPEVWRFDPDDWTFGFWLRREDGSYVQASKGLAFPFLEAADVIAQMKLAEEVGASRWFKQLSSWVRDTLLPRLGGPPAYGQ